MSPCIHRVAAAAAFTLSACAGGGSSDPGTTPPPPAPVVTVSVALDNPTVEAGGTAQATATLRDGNNVVLTGRAVSWSSSDPAIASIGSTGGIAPLAPGNVTIAASSEGRTGTAPLVVIAPTVATVAVALTTPLTVGATTQASATLRDSRGTALQGRTVAWSSSNPGIGTIDPAGRVTAVAVGTTTITATSEGRTGSAQLTVTQPPVASVAIFGTTRIKVGDGYSYTAEARLADGTLVQRPVTWSVVEPGRAVITAGGVLTPLVTGPITVRATVETVSFNGALTAYDWTPVNSGGVVGAFIDSDTPISNKFGTSEYPTLGIGCSSGTFVIYVDTDNFVTQNGLVSFNFDGGTIFSQTWLEFDLFSGLAHPGPTNLATKNFALTLAGSRTFGFAFTEFQSSARATLFRVTGLSSVLAPILNACPSNAIMAEQDGSTPMDRLRPFLVPSPMTPERAARQRQGVGDSPSPAGALSGVQAAVPMRLARP